MARHGAARKTRRVLYYCRTDANAALERQSSRLVVAVWERHCNIASGSSGAYPRYPCVFCIRMGGRAGGQPALLVSTAESPRGS